MEEKEALRVKQAEEGDRWDDETFGWKKTEIVRAKKLVQLVPL